jgi:nucleoside 2-deoxyribosyltransferase
MESSSKQVNHIFLGGPITHLSKHPRTSARVEKFLIIAENTFKEAGWAVHSAHITECFGRDVPTADIIVKRDIEWLSRSSYAIFLLPNDGDQNPLRTDGTFIEIGYAVCAKIPCSILIENTDGHSPMIHGLADFFNQTSLLTIDILRDDPTRIINSIRIASEAILPRRGLVG